MTAVRMVQPAVHEIVEMVTMRHPFMPAVWTVHVCAGDFRRAVHGICGVHRDDMFVHAILMHVVEMAVVKVVHMAIMANRSVPAVRAMPVGMIGMMLLGAGRHDRVLSSFGARSGPLVAISAAFWQLRKGGSCSRTRNESCRAPDQLRTGRLLIMALDNEPGYDLPIAKSWIVPVRGSNDDTHRPSFLCL